MVRGYDLVARIGGDEFVVLVESIEENQFVQIIGERIVKELSLPIDVDGEQAFIGASIGVAESDRADEVLTLVTHADHAMYEAKRAGKGQVIWYRPEA